MTSPQVVGQRIEFPDASYNVTTDENAEFDTTMLRFTYESLVMPRSVYDYDMVTHERKLLKRQPVKGGYDPDQYQTERVFATAADGTRVPISLVYRKDLKRKEGNPLLLYAYGSYGEPTDVWFSSNRLSLLDRGRDRGDCSRARGRRVRQALVRRGPDAEQAQHLHRLHRLRSISRCASLYRRAAHGHRRRQRGRAARLAR